MGDREGVPSQRPSAVRRQLDSNTATIGDTDGTVDLEKQEGSKENGDGLPPAPDAAVPTEAAAEAAGSEALDKGGSGAAGDSEQQEGKFAVTELGGGGLQHHEFPLNLAVLDGPSTELQPATYWEIFKHFGILGWTAFGGPAAHVAMFQQLFVDKLRWLTYLVFTELLMLGQTMPGPSSTQMGFAIGVLKKGLLGGAISGVSFQGPGLLILAILGWAASKVLDDAPAWLSGIVAGLAAAGIALVASAAKGLVSNVCKGRLLQVINTAAAVVAFYYPTAWIFPTLIGLGGLTTLILRRKEVVKIEDVNAGVERLGFTKLWGAVLIAVWVAVLVVTIVLSGGTEYESNKELHWFAAFYRIGSIIFGGGQVVLPMLFNVVVQLDCTPVPGGNPGQETCTEAPSSWMTKDQFYAGLALAQAMPGPLFNFAAYLGAVIARNAGVNAVLGVLICWVALFAPGIILIFAILPWWGMFRQWQFYRRALPGLNAAAVGLIVTSFFQLTLTAFGSSPFPQASVCIGIIAFGATEILKVPAPLVVIGGGVLGVIGWATHMY